MLLEAEKKYIRVQDGWSAIRTATLHGDNCIQFARNAGLKADFEVARATIYMKAKPGVVQLCLTQPVVRWRGTSSCDWRCCPIQFREVGRLRRQIVQHLAREWRCRLQMKSLTQSECLFDANAVVVIDGAATHVRVARIDRGVDSRALF